MSNKINEFRQLVQWNYDRCKRNLALELPVFINEAPLLIASMSGKKGCVEILFGPPEYHAEVIIETEENSKRYNLADLFTFKSVKAWMYENRTNQKDQSSLAADAEWMFNLLSEGLNGIEEFNWIRA